MSINHSIAAALVALTVLCAGSGTFAQHLDGYDEGGGPDVEVEVYGEGASTTLRASGAQSRIRHLQFGPSHDESEYIGPVIEDRYVPSCATGAPRFVVGDGRAHVSVASCQFDW